MIIPLIKKDIMIVKGYALCVIALGIGLPLLLAWRQPEMGGLYSFLMATLISSVAFNLAISEKENKYPKATALLASTPYMKSGIVRSKYWLYLIIYIVCCIPSFIETQFIPELAIDNFLHGAAIVFLIQAVCMGILLPIQFKFGYEKTKFLGFLIFLSAFLLTAAENIKLSPDIANYFNSSPIVLSLLIFAFGIITWLISINISKKIVAKKDLL